MARPTGPADAVATFEMPMYRPLVALGMMSVMSAQSTTRTALIPGIRFVCLVLLGVGWTFLCIGGTTLLTSTYTVAKKGRAQGANDMTVFAVGLFCSLGAAGLLKTFGWQTLNLLLLPWLATAMIALIWLGTMRRRQDRAVPTTR